MGESFKHEFEIGGVDTGRAGPPSTVYAPGPNGTMNPQTVPGQPIMRASFLGAFLSNLPSALAGGLAAQPGLPFGSGLSGSLQGIKAEEDSIFNRHAQIQNQQIHSALAASELTSRNQQINQNAQTFPLDLEEKRLQLETMKGLRAMANDDSAVGQLTSQMTDPLGQLSPDEKAQIEAGKVAFKTGLKQGKFSVDPIMNAVTKISQDRITAQRGEGAVDRQGLAAYLADPKIDSGVKNKNAATFIQWKARLAPQAQIPGKESARADKSYQYIAGRVDKLREPVASQMDRIARLQASIDQKTPQADALIAPELLTAMAGGAGSGLRMNEAEISRIVGGRTAAEDLKARLNRFNADPSKGLQITDAQRGQIKSLVDVMHAKLQKKLDAIDDANQQLLNSDDIKQHRQIYTNLQKSITNVDSGTAQPQGSGGLKIIRDKNGRIVGVE